MPGPLKGLKVLDLSRVLAGPWATQVLADFGADVWKIENPNGGDDTRKWGDTYSDILKNKIVQPTLTRALSEFKSEPESEPDYNADITAYYLSANRGKSSLTIDIKSEKGQKIIKKLVQQADILVENFKVGNLKKYGLDYNSLKIVNPKIIYCSITGFGQTGPYASDAGYDAMIQASAGLMSITGEKGGAPQKVGVAVSDLMTGMYAVSAILAAVHYRHRTGKGQAIDLALFDTQIAWLANQSMSFLLTGETPLMQGSSHPSIVPYQPIQCKDEPIMLAVGNDRQFKDCCRVLGIELLANDERFNTNNHRIQNHSLLIQLMEEKFQQFPSQYWLEKLSREKVPCGPINSIKQAFEHPQIEARETLFTLKHPTSGEMPQVANPVKFSESKINYSKAAPILGEDTQKILKEALDFSDDEIKELERLGVI